MADMDIAGVERLLREATPGPWRSPWNAEGDMDLCNQIYTEDGATVVGVEWHDGPQLRVSPADGDLIANAPACIAWLLSEVRRKNLAITEAANVFKGHGLPGMASLMRTAATELVIPGL